MQDDQRNRSGIFYTNQKGQVPPLVTTHFITQDQGNASPRFLRSSMYNVPATIDMMKQTAVPFGIVVSPLARTLDEEYLPPIVNIPEIGPVRCNRCKAYMCPFMQFIDGGRRFHCLFCKATTEVPPEYFQHLDHTGQRVDRFERPELMLGAYEFVATKDYCRNNTFPKPPAVIFLIDVSYNNIKSGMVHLLCSRMKEIVKLLPKDEGAEKSNMRVGFITYNNTVHFYNIKGCLAQPQMMVVGDVQDMFMPLLEGFLCDPLESEAVIDSLMEQIPTMFADTRETETVLAPAIQAGLEALKASECSGKLLVFHSSLPIAEAPGKLKNRDDRKLLGTEKERTVLAPQVNVYNNLGQECVGVGCSVDLFVFNNSYIDLATIGQVARLTGGEIYKYTYFQADLDGERLIADIKRDVSRPVAFDAIMRVRTSTGVRATDFYGHFFMSNTTDMELASIDCDKSDSQSGVLTKSSSTNRLIVIHAGSESGFVENSLLIFQAGRATGDYHGQMNSTNFERWVNTQLLPNLPEKSVVVMDNAPYHSIQENKPPTRNSVRAEMISWLENNNMPFAVEMRKTELFMLIEKHKCPEKTFRIDQILKFHGHDVLRLPPYMCDLSPIELAWAKVKRVICEKKRCWRNVNGSTEGRNNECIFSVTGSDCPGYCSHVRKLETQYWEKDGLLENTIDEFTIALGVPKVILVTRVTLNRMKKVTTPSLPVHCRTANKEAQLSSYHGADCNSDHYLVIGELRERLSVAKRVEQQVNITKFNIFKLKDEEAKQNYQVEISNRFATLESSEKELDVNSVWENIRDSIKIAAEQSIGYYETKKKKPWFDEDCCMVVERRKQAKLKFLQDPVEEKRDNYFNERREASRTLRNKKRGYLKEKLNEVETNSKNKNIRDLYKGIKEFKNGYQPRAVAIEIKHDDKLTEEDGVYIQVALLYTSCGGQRRLRILNLSLKTCSQMADLYRSCDLDTIVNFFSKQAVFRLLDSSPKPVKENLVNRCAQMLACYRKNCASPSSAGQLILPECMKLLPLYVNCILKSDAISGGSDMTVDDRSFVMQAVTVMDIPSSVVFFYPRLIPLHEIDVNSNELPSPIRCTSDKIRDDGVYLLGFVYCASVSNNDNTVDHCDYNNEFDDDDDDDDDDDEWWNCENGIHLFLWIGLNVGMEWVQNVFGVHSAAQIDIDRTALPDLDNPLSQRIRSVIDSVREQRHRCMRLTLVRQRDKLEMVFKHFLMEDRGLDGSASYVDFLCHMHKEIRNLLS
ncbi:hypothetical protein ANN_27270 [Periplaneta americana]|uniref:Protein transport protein Sec24C n=1 Tax=Periplaneta americana TaxID=6978 RepID=A0ABQ8RXK9_PERAM|nr:hypothetical protein ANN_27270 [Periplaneta americana]